MIKNFSFRLIKSDGTPNTGQGTNITYRVSPYGTPTNLVTPSGGTTEIGTQGNYIAVGFTHAIQDTQVYLNGVLQTALAPTETGSLDATFVHLTGNETIAGNKEFTGAAVFDESVEFDSTVVFVAGQTVALLGDSYYANPLIVNPAMTPADANLICKAFADAHYGTDGTSATWLVNKIVVNGDEASNIVGKKYKSIKEAVNYIHTTGSPSAGNRWTIEVHETKLGYYTEDFYWYDFISIIGVSPITIKNTTGFSAFIRSGTMGDMNVKGHNLNFENSDTDLDFRAGMFSNCTVYMIEDNYAPNLTLHSSQFQNVNFSFNSSGNIVTVATNRVINCTASQAITWQTADKVYGFTVVEGDFIHQ